MAQKLGQLRGGMKKHNDADSKLLGPPDEMTVFLMYH